MFGTLRRGSAVRQARRCAEAGLSANGMHGVAETLARAGQHATAGRQLSAHASCHLQDQPSRRRPAARIDGWHVWLRLPCLRMARLPCRNCRERMPRMQAAGGHRKHGSLAADTERHRHRSIQPGHALPQRSVPLQRNQGNHGAPAHRVCASAGAVDVAVTLPDELVLRGVKLPPHVAQHVAAKPGIQLVALRRVPTAAPALAAQLSCRPALSCAPPRLPSKETVSRAHRQARTDSGSPCCAP